MLVAFISCLLVSISLYMYFFLIIYVLLKILSKWLTEEEVSAPAIVLVVRFLVIVLVLVALVVVPVAWVHLMQYLEEE